MIYDSADFDRMKDDPELRRQYVWQVGQAALQRSIRLRAAGKYEQAKLEAGYARIVLDHIDWFAAE